MTDLVGSTCLACNERIVSILDGKRCIGCGTAYHDRCFPVLDDPPEDGICSDCGAVLSGDHAHRSQSRYLKSVPQSPSATPVSKVCPNCGSTNARKVKPKRTVAFALDRVCTECQTRYSPPTPIWAAIVFITSGLLLSGLGTISILIRVANGNPVIWIGSICEGILAFAGVLSLIHGIRCLASPGKL